MATTDHPSTRQPQDTNGLLWRYMSFAKYCHLLQTRSLWFAQLKLLSDPHEGRWSAKSQGVLADWYRSLPPPIHGKPEAPEKWATGLLQINASIARHWHYANCWCMKPSESVALWTAFAAIEGCVCIRTTYTRLAAVLPEMVHLGCVEYRDYSNEIMDQGNIFAGVMSKRTHFREESEVRAVYPLCCDPGVPHPDEIEKAPMGIAVPVQIEELILDVRVAPNSPEWIRACIEGITRKAGCDFPVVRSQLDEVPFA